MKNVLIACSLAPSAKANISASIRIANSWRSRIFFCHVGNDTPLIRKSLQLLLADAGILQPSVMIRQGTPDQVIRHCAEEVSADLIIAGAIGHEKTFVGIWGSVARRLVRKAHCSVLLLTGIPSQFESFQHIVVRIDYQELGKLLIQEAIKLANSLHAQLHIVHEFEYSLRLLSCEETIDGKRIAGYERECSVNEQERLRDFIEGFDVKGLKPQYACLAAKDRYEFKKYVHMKNIDLVVTPAPLSRWTLWDRLFNVPVEAVLQDMPCSMLFYRKV